MFTPRGFETWNRALRGAYRKGYEVGVAGVDQSDAECPYLDIRKPSGRLSWSRGFITAWWDGHREGRTQWLISQRNRFSNYPVPRR